MHTLKTSLSFSHVVLREHVPIIVLEMARVRQSQQNLYDTFSNQLFNRGGSQVQEHDAHAQDRIKTRMCRLERDNWGLGQWPSPTASFELSQAVLQQGRVPSTRT